MNPRPAVRTSWLAGSCSTHLLLRYLVAAMASSVLTRYNLLESDVKQELEDVKHILDCSLRTRDFIDNWKEDWTLDWFSEQGCAEECIEFTGRGSLSKGMKDFLKTKGLTESELDTLIEEELLNSLIQKLEDLTALASLAHVVGEGLKK